MAGQRKVEPPVRGRRKVVPTFTTDQKRLLTKIRRKRATFRAGRQAGLDLQELYYEGARLGLRVVDMAAAIQEDEPDFPADQIAQVVRKLRAAEPKRRRSAR